MVQFILGVVCAFFIGYLLGKIVNKKGKVVTSPPIQLIKVVNRDRKNRENPYYYIGRVSREEGVLNVAFTAKEIDKAVIRADKNETDFLNLPI